MTEAADAMVAACGLDCRICPLRAATIHEGGPLTVIELLSKLGVIKEDERSPGVTHRDLFCPTCRGDRTLHWSEDCSIRKCCVDDKGLEHCSECGDFPCEQFSDWAKTSPRQAEAMKRLHSMSGNTDPPPAP
jgi:hypothetical protein